MECRTLSRHSSLGSEAVMSVLYNAHSTQRMLSVAREMDIDPTFHKAKNTRTHKRSRSIACTWHAHSTRTHKHTHIHRTHIAHTQRLDYFCIQIPQFQYRSMLYTIAYFGREFAQSKSHQADWSPKTRYQFRL